MTTDASKSRGLIGELRGCLTELGQAIDEPFSEAVGSMPDEAYRGSVSKSLTDLDDDDIRQGCQVTIARGEGSDRHALEAAKCEIAQLRAQVADLQKHCTFAVPKHGRTDVQSEEQGICEEGDAAHVAVPQIAVSGVSLQGEWGDATQHGSTSATESDLSIWKELFQKLNRSGGGKLSLAELEAAVQGEPGMTRLMDRKLRDLLAQLHEGKKTGVDLPEFAAVMKERFERSFALFFESAGVPAQLTAAAWKYVIGDGGCEALLREESQHMQCFQSLRRQTREERVRIFRALLDAVSGPLASQMADAVGAASEYNVEELQQAASGKFKDMALGHTLCFEIGPDALLGFMDLDCEAAISREHASNARFKAWNNDMERETSPAEQLRLVLENGWGGKINNKDYHGNIMCEDFGAHAMAKAASLLKAELVMLRLYTGPMYKVYNTLLRDLLKHVNAHVAAMRGEGHAVTTDVVREAFGVAREKLAGRGYTTSLLVLISALIKLRTVSDLPPERKVFRGVSGLNVPDCFKDEDERGNRGGVEFGFCSTSTSKAQAIGYIDFDKGMPQLYEMDVGQIDRGASVDWISFFPAEQEVLLPPLCSIEAVGTVRYEEVQVLCRGTGGASSLTTRTVMVWPMRLNVNLKGKTVEEHQGTRKTLHAQMAEHAHRELVAEVARQTALGAEGEGAESAEGAEGAEGVESGPLQKLGWEIRAQSKAVVAGYGGQAEGCFNEDARYSAAIQDVLQLKPWAERMLSLGRAAAKYGLTLAQLQTIQLKAFSKALTLVCVERGLFTEHAEEADANGLTALARTCFLGPQEDLELLLESGARVEALHKQDLLHSAIIGRRSEAVARLIDNKCDVNKADKEGRTPLGLACRTSGKDGVSTVLRLIEEKCNLDTTDLWGHTALYHAADVGALDTVGLLIEAKCNIDKDFQGIIHGTPLRVAAEKGHVEVVKELLAAAAGKTVLGVDGTEHQIANEQVEDEAVLAALATKWIEDAQNDRMYV